LGARRRRWLWRFRRWAQFIEAAARDKAEAEALCAGCIEDGRQYLRELHVAKDEVEFESIYLSLSVTVAMLRERAFG